MVCAFVTNEYMQDGTKELPNNVEVSLKDVKLYLSSTKEEINKILKTNFDELEINLNNILQASGRIVTEQLAEYSHAVSLTNLSDIVAGLESIKEDLKTMQTITRDLRTNASQLDIGMDMNFYEKEKNLNLGSKRKKNILIYIFPVVRGVKNNLLHTLAACKTQNCKQVLHDYKVNQMSVQVDFDKVFSAFLLCARRYIIDLIFFLFYMHSVHGPILPEGMIILPLT